MMIQISADPFSGQPVISVCSDYCTIITEGTDPSAQSPIRSPLPPSVPVRRRIGSLVGMSVVAIVAILVGASFSSYRSSNAASQNASAEGSRTPPRSLAAREVPPQAPSERQGQRLEEALAGHPVVTPPPGAPAKGAGNPFGLE